MENLKAMLAKDAMVSTLKTANERSTMSDINDILLDYNIHHVPVVGESGELKGMISKHDIDLLKLNTGKFGQESLYAKQKRILDTQLARDVMTTKMVTVSPDSPIMDVVEIFQKNRVHALPVIDNGNLVGIITPYDLIRIAYT